VAVERLVVHLEQRAPVAVVVLARIDRILAPLTWLAAAFAVLVLLVGPALIGAKKVGGATARAPAAAAAPSGRKVFSSAGCGGCHTLAAAGSTGRTGPNLDDAKPSPDAVERIVTSGSGIMPSFKQRLSAAEITAVAQFVSGSEPSATATAPSAATGARRSSVAATIRVGGGPDGITAAGSDVWVADATGGRLRRIDAGSNGLAGAAVPAGRQPDNPLVVDGAVWVVASGDDAVLRVANGRTTSISVGRAPEALAAAGRFLWVTNAGDGTVSRIDPEAARVVGRPIEVGGRPLDIAADKDAVWVTSFTDGTVTRLDPRSGDVQGEPIKVGRHPRGVAIGEGSTWVANAGDGTITRIDPAQAAVVGEPIRVGRDPRELEVGEGFVWVANAGDGTVTRIDPTGKVAGEPIEVGEDPIGIAVGAGAVWTANFRAGTVTRIRP
jgi:DNA-binding beta-propeller fold protein YncE/mono/diheme cytochrome c family protein